MNEVLLSHFFPSHLSNPLPCIFRPYNDYLELSPDQITKALSACSPTSAPGPYNISYSIWKKAHRAAPSILTSFLGSLPCFGHHLASLKRANGVVFDHLGKLS